MVVVFALLAASTIAKADEFADVDAEVLTKGVEILAAKWMLPIVVFYGATDEFSETSDRAAASPSVLKPVSLDSLHDPWRPCAYGDMDARLTSLLRFSFAYECMAGAVTRRRD
ncbi:MAG: hypothetical protein ACR2RF_25890 [Geminicoccaceae bacterium]